MVLQAVRGPLEVALGGTILLFLIPQVPKEFCSGWSMPRVMVVAECKDFQNFGVAHQRSEYRDPIFQITRAVNDDFVPRRRLLLNSFAVSKPANISEVRRNQIKFLFHLPRSRHKRCVG